MTLEPVVEKSLLKIKYVQISHQILRDMINDDCKKGNTSFIDSFLDILGKDVQQIKNPTTWLGSKPDPYLYFKSSKIDKLCKSNGAHYLKVRVGKGSAIIEELTPA